MNKLTVIFIGVVLLTGCTFVTYVIAKHAYQEKIDSLVKQNDRQKKRTEQLNQTADVRSASKNRAFFEAFFNYSDAEKRYENVRKVTTNKGFDFTFPSRSNQKHAITVKSELLSLESYSMKIDGSHELYLNVAEVASTSNSVTSHQTLIVQTSLIKENGEWLVDEVQVKGNG